MATALVQTQAQLALAKNLLLNQLQNQALQKQAQAEELLRNNLYLFLQKIPVSNTGIFLFFGTHFFIHFLFTDSDYF